MRTHWPTYERGHGGIRPEPGCKHMSPYPLSMSYRRTLLPRSTKRNALPANHQPRYRFGLTPFVSGTFVLFFISILLYATPVNRFLLIDMKEGN
ncbi:hypothetical protein LZ31DRAFT_75878 [Colletotrichum somersetense]|nr:hypothetical protein LZ31DRAFT_75878 [Colletotrichum somersetense]